MLWGREHCLTWTLLHVSSGADPLWSPAYTWFLHITQQLLLGRICQAEIVSIILLMYSAGEMKACLSQPFSFPGSGRDWMQETPMQCRLLYNLLLRFTSTHYIYSPLESTTTLPSNLYPNPNFSCTQRPKTLYALTSFGDDQRCLSLAFDLLWQPRNLLKPNCNIILWRIHNSSLLYFGYSLWNPFYCAVSLSHSPKCYPNPDL